MAKHMRTRKHGFSLVEMAIVLIIIAVIVGGGLVIFSNSLDKQRYEETEGKLKVITQALADYRRAFGRLPCPADITRNMEATSSNYYGIEGATPGMCTGGTPSASALTGPYFVDGMVPTKTLRLPDDAAIDGWGRRITYVVDNRLTAANAFTSITVSDSTTRMSVTTNTATPVTLSDKVVYVVLSYGENGHGATPRSGGATIISSGSSNTHELENCDCTSTAAAGTANSIFVQGPPNTEDTSDVNKNFDDLLVYATRAGLRSGAE